MLVPIGGPNGLTSPAGLPIYVDEEAPRWKWVEHDGPAGVPWVSQRVRIDVDYTLVQTPGTRPYMLVHPDRWPDFRDALKMLTRRRAVS